MRTINGFLTCCYTPKELVWVLHNFGSHSNMVAWTKRWEQTDVKEK